MATSIKVVLRRKKTKNNTYPLAIRITKDGKSSFMHFGKNIEEQYWNPISCRVRKSYPNSVRLNNLIIKKLAEAEDVLIETQANKNELSPAQIKNQIREGDAFVSFFDLADEYLRNKESTGKFNQLSADSAKFNHFRKFLKGGDIDVRNITKDLLKKYDVYLQVKYSNGRTTIYNKLNVIRIIYNIVKDAGVVDGKDYPFGKRGVKMKPGKSMKIGLTKEEVKRIEDLEPLNSSDLLHAKHVWLFSFYFGGMRFSDVITIKWPDMVDERLYYRMRKNSEPVSVRIPEKAKAILEYYKSDQRFRDDYVFPELKRADQSNMKDIYRKMREANQSINYHLQNNEKRIQPDERNKYNTKPPVTDIAELCGIEKKLTMHIARHTFGNICKGSIPVDILQLIYRHKHISTTIGYQNNFIHDKTDAALDEVVNF